MIARTQEHPTRSTLSAESSADSRFAVIEPREERGTDEDLLESGSKPYSWGILTSVPASSSVRRRRPEQRHASPVKSALTRSGPEAAPRDRAPLAGWSALARQLAARQRLPSHLQVVEAYRRHAIRGCGVSHLHCGLCRQNEVVPFFVHGVWHLPVVQDVPHGGHGALPDRTRSASGAVAVRAVPAVSGQAAGRVRLMGVRLGAAAPGAGRLGPQRRVGMAPAQIASSPNRGASAPAPLGGVASTRIPAPCGRIGCSRTMCVRVSLGPAQPEL
jgi:hypothetical protein